VLIVVSYLKLYYVVVGATVVLAYFPVSEILERERERERERVCVFFSIYD